MKNKAFDPPTQNSLSKFQIHLYFVCLPVTCCKTHVYGSRFLKNTNKRIGFTSQKQIQYIEKGGLPFDTEVEQDLRYLWPDLGKPVLCAHQLYSTFCLYVKATLMHYPETQNTWR